MSDKSTTVVSLVQRLKQGDITKEQLFEHLSKIQKAKKATKGSPQKRRNAPPGTDVAGDVEAEALKQARERFKAAQAGAGGGSDTHAASPAQAPASPAQSSSVSAEKTHAAAAATSNSGSYAKQTMSSSTKGGASGTKSNRQAFIRSLLEDATEDIDGGATQTSHGGSLRATPQKRHMSSTVSRLSSTPTSSTAARARANAGRSVTPQPQRSARAASPSNARRAPSPSPRTSGGIGSSSSYGRFDMEDPEATMAKRPGSARKAVSSREAEAFFKRQEAWANRKESDKENMQRKQRDRDLAACTFQPKVLPHDNSSNVTTEDVATRLYQQHQRRNETMEAERQRRIDEQVNSTCTFKPKINSNSRNPTPVKSRYRQPSPRRVRAAQEEMKSPEPDAECTFKPTINGITPEMANARMYLEESAFDRLSKPRVPTQSMLGESMNATETLSRHDVNHGSRPASPARGPSTPGQNYSYSTAHNDSSATNHSRGDFGSFIERQNEFQEHKRNHVKQIERNVTREQRSTPSLCRKSLVLAKRRHQEVHGTKGSDFLSRVQNVLEKKKEAQQRAENSVAHDFKPLISERAASLPHRSIDDLSRGDMERISMAHEALVRQKEDEDAKVLTFKPQIRAKKGIESRLKVASDPDNYLKRVESQTQNLQRMQYVHVQAKKEAEVKECTFKPQVHESPAFVKRIASSVRRSGEGTSRKCVEAATGPSNFKFS